MALDKNNVIAREIRNRNWRFIIISLIGIALIVAFAAYNRAYLTSFFRGPVEIDSQTLVETSDLDQLDVRWVTVQGERVVNTGWVETSQTTVNGVPTSGVNTSHTYFVVVLNDNTFLLAEMGAELENTEEVDATISGGLVPFSSVVSKDILPGLRNELSDLDLEFLPYMLTTDDFRTNGYIGLGVGGVIVLLAGFVLLRSFARVADPTKDAAYKALEHFGEPALVSHEIQQELDGLPRKEKGKLAMTDHWAVLRHGGLKFTRHRDVMWVYPKVTTTRAYGVIPVSKATELLWFDRYGQQFSMPINKKQLDPLMNEFAQRSPGVILGYNAELAGLWAKNRAEFIAAVDSRRSSAANQPPRA
jgi:hypothetical protein